MTDVGQLTKDATPTAIKPFLSLGVDLTIKDKDAVGDCPLCGKGDNKFSVSCADGRWQCWVCGDKGNVYTFIRALWGLCPEVDAQRGHEQLAGERGLLSAATLVRWGVRRSFLTGGWLVPGHSLDGKLSQLYRWVHDPESGKMRLWPTAGLSHTLLGVPLLQHKDEVHITEGCWDGMAWWEVMRDDVDVLVQPGANVFLDAWPGFFMGRRVCLFPHNDHPRNHPKTGKLILPAGWEGAKRVAQKLHAAGHPPATVKVLHWGGESANHDLSLKSGYDLRDHLRQIDIPQGRRAFALALMDARLLPSPRRWYEGPQPLLKGQGVHGEGDGDPNKKRPRVTPLPCDDFKVLANAWRLALRWRRDLEDILVTCLAVCLSTDQQGNQLFLQVIGDPGSAKTTMLDGLLVSQKCFALEHLTGFHSGWQGSGGEDFSLLSRINHMTLVTPEADVMMGNPRWQEIMSQQRRIFDGKSGASYKNRKDDLRWEGLRTPWIMAGTPAMLNKNEVRLGDRFLKIYVERPDHDERQEILTRSGWAGWDEVNVTSNCDPLSTTPAALMNAQRLAGGYVNHLRDNAAGLISAVQVAAEIGEPAEVVDYCSRLGDLVALLRASKPEEVRRDYEPTAELPTRLTHQFSRLVKCLAVVAEAGTLTAGSLQRLTKVALDTGRGRTLSILKALHGAKDGALLLSPLSHQLGEGEDLIRSHLKFLHRLGAVESFHLQSVQGQRTWQKWRLTALTRELCEGVL